MGAPDSKLFDNSYARLSGQFYTRLAPVPVQQPGPIRVNRELAQALGLDPDWLASPEGVAVIAGNALPEGAEPIATVYAGHQFGSYNPQLGDGRAVLLGELVSGTGKRYDWQLKGSGPTPYSRGGDGRSPLGPVLREYVVSECMHRLGVPTTRALAAVTTGELVLREQQLPGAVLARVASSHIRIGTFQFFAAHRNIEALQALADHVIDRHYPDARDSDNPVESLLEHVIAAQAKLVAGWQALGFIHGVMNTDNMLLSGETIDYGPCAFMDEFRANQVYSSIDHGGRYAYRNQPAIAHWNLSCLAQALLPILDHEEEQAVALAQAAIDRFPHLFLNEHSRSIAAKLGLAELHEEDSSLVEDLFELLEEHNLDFTLSFRRLADLVYQDGAGPQNVAELFEFPEGMQHWLARWRKRIAEEPGNREAIQAAMYAASPALVPRNHLVEAVIEAATFQGDFEPFHALVDALDKPHEYHPNLIYYATPPRPEEVVRQTFCGT